MSDRAKKWIVGCIAGGIINGVFWFIYSFTENIVGSIGITAGVSISTLASRRARRMLYMLGKRKTS